MTSFIGGPADGVVLSLRTAPLLLRVTYNPLARYNFWDALDLEDDEALPHERICVYERHSEPFWYHVKASGDIRGWWPHVSYYPVTPEIDGELVRSRGAWHAFCTWRSIVKPENPG